jgi:cysteinyl-tRNA synthetase
VASLGHNSVRYWMHNNMVTINGQKMGKSLGNFITLEEFFAGNHALLTQAYSAMTIRFFILQAHYRSTVDFSNEALQASEKGLSRLLDAYDNIERLVGADVSPANIADLVQKSYDALNDDLNTPMVIAQLFEAARLINSALDGSVALTADNIRELKDFFRLFLFDLLGIKNELKDGNAGYESFSKAVDMLLQMRMQAKQNKDWATSDKIRDDLTALGFEIKDTKDGFEWKLSK